MILLLASSFLTAVATVESKAATSRPNIIFILADDVGFGEVSCS